MMAQQLTFESLDDGWRDLLVEGGQHLGSRAKDDTQALGRCSSHLPTHVIVITVFIIFLTKGEGRGGGRGQERREVGRWRGGKG